MKDISLYDSPFSSRTLEIVISPRKEIDSDSLLLVSRLLKQKFESLSTGELGSPSLCTEAIYLGGRLSLSFRYSQCEDKSITFLFKDPYKEMDRIVSSLLSEPFKEDEKVLSSVLRGIKMASSSELFLSANRIDFASVVPTKKIYHLSYSDIESAREILSSSPVVLRIYSGTQKRDYPTLLERETIEDRNVELSDVISYAKEDETLVLDVIHKNIENNDDRLSFLLSFEVFKRECSLFFKRMMFPSIKYDYRHLGRDRTILLLSFSENNLSLLRKQIPFKKNSPVPFLYSDKRMDVMEVGNDILVSRIDEESYFKKIRESAALGLDNVYTFKEDIKGEEFFSSMKIQNIYTAMGGKK